MNLHPAPTRPDPLLRQTMTTAAIKKPILRMQIPHSGAGVRILRIPTVRVLRFCPDVRLLQLRMSREFFSLLLALYINYLCTRSDDVTPSFPTSDRKRSWKSFYASLHLSPESLEAHLDSAASSPVLAPSRRLSVTRAASPSAHDSDQDAYGESDGDDDDEYVPFVETNPRKRSRSSVPVRRNVSPSPYSHHNRRSVKRARVSPPSRNKQASSTTSVAIREAVSAVSCHQMNFICPECGWKQSNRRMPDFKRHMKTHTRPTEDDQSKGWWCKGVLLENVDQYKKIPRDALPYMFLGQERIGGCMRTFSRRDALKRHLDNGNVQCIGTPCAAAQEE